MLHLWPLSLNTHKMPVGVRLPDGSRALRRFPSAAPLQSLYDFCLARSEEAAGTCVRMQLFVCSCLLLGQVCMWGYT
jgi:hypothetical protein